MSALSRRGSERVRRAAAATSGAPASAAPASAAAASAAAAGGPEASRRVVEGRLGALSVRAGMTVGGWIGFALGLVLGAVLGALLCWFADAVLGWQHDLGVTLGVAQNLLPFGDQAAILRTISREWYLVIPIVAFAGGLIWAIVGALVAGIVTVGYNLASRRVVVTVEFEDSAEIAVAPQIATIPRIRALPSGTVEADAPDVAEAVGATEAADGAETAGATEAAGATSNAPTAARMPDDNADAAATARITSGDGSSGGR